MFLKEIKLVNFRNIEELKFSFTNYNGEIRPMTLLLGENGTGKSGLLKAIAIITAGSNALGDILSDIDSYVRYGTKSTEIIATLITKKGEERHLELKFNRGDHLKELIRRSYETLDEIDGALEHADRNYFVLGYGASRRLNSDISYSSRSTNLRYVNIATLFDQNASLNPLESWAIDLDYQHGEEGIQTVREVLSDFLGDISFDHIDKENRRIMFKTVYGIVPLNSLSDGYQNVAAWIGDLLYRITNFFRDYKNPLSTRGLLLIDEIDLHLHPKWQRKLLTFLKSKLPNFQIIASTHSPLTAQQAQEGELFVLSNNKDNNIQIAKFAGNPSSKNIDQLLTSDLFKLTSSRSKEVEDLINNRDVILTSAVITKKGKVSSISDSQRKELDKINEQLNSLSISSDYRDDEAMNLIRNFADKIKSNKLSE